MCIFSQPVTSVSSTRIFARPTGRSTQFLVYQMNYESREPNAMILPIPVRQPAGEESLRFIDLEGYPEFFDDLSTGFPYQPPPYSVGCSASRNGAAADSLTVFNVGNYIASFVPSLTDFSRLDERFTLPKSTWAQVPQYAKYGFAVFQLAAGSLTPHPMAFEFETALESIFFPTLHIHDGEVHASEPFDHVLYVQHAGLDSRVSSYQNSDVLDTSTGLIRSKYTAREFCDIARCSGVVDKGLLVHRKFIQGAYPNSDTEIGVVGSPTVTTFNVRPLLEYTPWLLISAAATWLFSRRCKIKRISKLARQSTPP